MNRVRRDVPKKKWRRKPDPEEQCLTCKKKIELGARFCAQHSPSLETVGTP